MSNRYVVFLDIDGVFTSTRVHLAKDVESSAMWDTFDPIAVDVLNSLDRNHYVDFVLMTTWVEGLKNSDKTMYHWVTAAFRNAGFRGNFPFPGWKVNPADKPQTWENNRAHWVKDYLAAERLTYDDFMVIDDTDYKFNDVLGKKRFVQPDGHDGLLTKHIKNIRSLTGTWEKKDA